MYKCDTVCTIYTFAVILLNTALWDGALVKCGVFVYVLQELSTIPEHFHLGSVVESQKTVTAGTNPVSLWDEFSLVRNKQGEGYYLYTSTTLFH